MIITSQISEDIINWSKDNNTPKTQAYFFTASQCWTKTTTKTFINVILRSFYFAMQTMAITQRKNIQYLSRRYPVTFIPFDALSSLSGRERREFKFVASSHVVLPPTVTANAMNPQLLTVHWLSSLTFLLYESSYQSAVCLIIQSFQLHSPLSGVK